MFINKKSLWWKWLGVATVTILLMALALFSYWAVERNQRDVSSLENKDLPLLKAIQSLRVALITAESSVYEYYLTTDVERFHTRYGQQREHINDTLLELSAELEGLAQLESVSNLSKEVERTTNEFLEVMTRSPIDWDAARDVLERFGPLTERANRDSQALTSWVQQRVLRRSHAHSLRVRQSLYLVSFLVGLAGVAAAWLAYSKHIHLQSLREQKRLASFPLSNPHPVLALDQKGGIIYANEAARACAYANDLNCLLPDDIDAHLRKSEVYEEWEFEKRGRCFHFSLGYLKAYGEYHAYLSDITARKRAEENLAYLAYHDATTGLINRQQFNEFVEAHIESNNASLLVAMMDLDLLGQVVSSAGVSVAEMVARLAAKRFEQAIEEENCVKESCLSYVGGGLFCFACPRETTNLDSFFKRMQAALALPFDVDGFEFHLRLTIGIVTSEDICERTGEEALRLADGALQLAKSRGLGHIAYYARDIEKKYQYRLAVERGLRQAIEKEELQLYYQPKISLISNQVSSVEALLRWRHPEHGFVSPADFIPIAEHSGQILEIGQWVLEQACEDLKAWNQGRAEPVTVAVNLSAKQLLHSDIDGQVLNATRRYDIPVTWVELEITETAALSDFDRALDKLQQLAAIGVSLSLDDFGTGYSSLSYLQRLPVSILKIDRSFIIPIEDSDREATLARSMIRMAQQLDLKVVAEGVETRNQLELLQAWGCEYVQGFVFAKPMPVADLIEFLHSFDKQSAPLLVQRS